jgi:tetratricopeptide (TPR) repeat protein
VHYRIPEIGYWTILALSLLIGLPTLGASLAITGVTLFGFVAAIQGIVRWRIAKHHSRGAVIVPVFSCSSTGKAKETQDTIMSTLQDHLTQEEMESVYRIPATIGRSDRDFAARLCKRLSAFLVLQGDVRESDGDKWSVYASVCQPLDRVVTHIDPHTRDRTPAKADWRWIFRRLTGVDEIPQREYPFEFANELRAVIQGTAGQLAVKLDDFKRAESLIQEAMRVAPTSRSAQIDVLRIDRAKALVALGRFEEALRLLRKRSTQSDASPELLRFLDWLLWGPMNPNRTKANAQEAVAALRQAAKDRGDPQRDMTLYNLAQRLVGSTSGSEQNEAEQLMLGLAKSKGHYRHVWHVKRGLGAIAYTKWLAGFHKGSPDPTLAAEAGMWYSRTLRARPKFKLFYKTEVGRRPFTRFPVPPILFANARDGHQHAGHMLRARWYESRFHWKRRRMMKRGLKWLGKSEWRRAEANFDWCRTVGRGDPTEIKAEVLHGIAVLQYGDEEGAEEGWARAFALNPGEALISRAQAFENFDLPQGIPGDGPSDLVGAVQLAVEGHKAQLAPKKRFWQL